MTPVIRSRVKTACVLNVAHPLAQFLNSSARAILAGTLQPHSQPASEVRRPPSRSVGFAFAWAILAASALSGCGPGEATANGTENDPRRKQSTLTTTSNDIWARYRENEFLAQALFSGKVLTVTGTVAGTEMEDSAQPIILLASPDDRYPVRAALSPAARAKAADLNVGDKQVFTCTGITTLAQSQMLLNCSF